jgi:hypothetical protein
VQIKVLELHKDGKCTVDDVIAVWLTVDKNITRCKRKMYEYIESDFVRGKDGNTIYLSSLRKRFKGHLEDYEPYETASFYNFRKSMIRRTILREKRKISYKAIATRFGVCVNTVGKAVRELAREGLVIVEENYILVNAGDRTDGGFKREKHLPVNSLRISNNYRANRNFKGSARPVKDGNAYTRNTIPGNPRKYYYFSQEVWHKLGNNGPVDNDEVYRMSRSLSGSALLYKALKRCRRYSEKQVIDGFV